jgi:putative membrane protein
MLADPGLRSVSVSRTTGTRVMSGLRRTRWSRALGAGTGAAECWIGPRAARAAGRREQVNRIGWSIVGTALPLAPAEVWAQERGWEWGWGMHPMSGMWGVWGIGMMLMMLVFWGLVIVGIVFGIRWLVRQDRQGSPPTTDSALEILRQRYARGEINREEFETRRRDLER